MKRSSRYIKRREFSDKHLHPKLRKSLRLYLTVALALIIYVIFSTVKNGANPTYVLFGLITGITIGVLFGRIYKISWDEETEKVIYKMDILGIMLLLVFIAFDLSRGSLVSSFISGASVGPTSLALLAGAFYGRVFGAGRNIISVLRQREVIPHRKSHSK